MITFIEKISKENEVDQDFEEEIIEVSSPPAIQVITKENIANSQSITLMNQAQTHYAAKKKRTRRRFMEEEIEEIPLLGENYDNTIKTNEFQSTEQEPLSTFSIDVDTASYTNARRILTQNHRAVPSEAIRVEEFVNYFDYDYPKPQKTQPFSINLEMSQSPWNTSNKLVRIGLQGKVDETKPSEEFGFSPRCLRFNE